MVSESDRLQPINNFKAVSTKVALIKELRDMVEILPPIQPGDPRSLAKSEARMFQSFIHKVNRSLPLAAQRATQLDQLGKSTDASGRTYFRKRGAILLGHEDPAYASQDQKWSRFNRWMDNPDIRFLVGMREGIKSALAARGMVRSAVDQLGNDWNNPLAYAPYIPEDYAAFRGQIKEVIPQKFSIALMAENSVFNNVFEIGHILKQTGGDLTIDAFLFSGTILGLVREQPYIRHYLADRRMQPPAFRRLPQSAIDTILSNEVLGELDFRSFIDDFRLDLDQSDPNLAAAQRKVDSLKVAKLLREPFRPQILKALQGDLDRFTDSHYEDFVAEFLISPLRSTFFRVQPFGSTNTNLELKRQQLEGFKGTEDPAIAKMVAEAQSRTSFEDLNNTFIRFRNQIERNRPDKVRTLAAAYMLFTPSQAPLLERYLPQLLAAH